VKKDGESAPILMLTARDGVADRVKGLDIGADDYMVKPFALSELLARVRAFQRRASAVPGSTTLSVGDLTLDMRTREAIRAGKRIELTSKEYSLLELLMRSPGQVFTRSQILDRVWSFDAQIESNVLETYIHYLRNKVDRGYDPQLIRTVRGVGYSIKVP
jgi:two-component system response regulator MprA